MSLTKYFTRVLGLQHLVSGNRRVSLLSKQRKSVTIMNKKLYNTALEFVRYTEYKFEMILFGIYKLTRIRVSCNYCSQWNDTKKKKQLMLITNKECHCINISTFTYY